jgi:hypothetical protein
VSSINELKAEIAENQRRISIIESYERGEPIQRRRRHGNGEWHSVVIKVPGWDFDNFEFRKKPEPEVIYCNEYIAKHNGKKFFGVYDTLKEAQRLAVTGAVRIGVKFVEVVE